MNSSWTSCNILIWLSFRQIQLSALLSSFDAIFDLNSTIGHIAVLKPISLGLLHNLSISSHYFVASGILLLSVSVMQAAVPSSCILSPRYFWAVEFSSIWVPILIVSFSASFNKSVHDCFCHSKFRFWHSVFYYHSSWWGLPLSPNWRGSSSCRQ